MIIIIRQPINAYPSLGNAVDGTLSTNKFSFIFSGDKLTSYKITIKDAYTNSAVYTGSVTNLTLYNGQLFEALIPAGSFANGRDLIWSARLTQATSDIKVTNGTVQTGSTTTSVRLRPNSGIKTGMVVTIGSETKTITSYVNYLQISSSTLNTGSTYTIIQIAPGLTQANTVGYTLMISGNKRTIISYNATTGAATVGTPFTSLYSSGTSYYIIDENVSVAGFTSGFSSSPSLGTLYAVYTSFIDTPNYFFKSRALPTLTLRSLISGLTLANSGTNSVEIQHNLVQGSDMLLDVTGYYTGLECASYVPSTGIWTWVSTPFPVAFPMGTAYTTYADITTTLTSRKGNFLGTYSQAQGTGIKYHIFNLYDETGLLIDTTGQVFNGLLEYSYEGFISGKSYSIEMIVMTQENVLSQTAEYEFAVSYPEPDLTYPPAVTNLSDLNAVQVEWIEDKQCVGVATGTYSFVTDFPFAGTNSVDIQTGIITFSEISSNPISIPLNAYTIFTSINTPITNNGGLISINDAPADGGDGYLKLSIDEFILYKEVYDYTNTYSKTAIGTVTIPTAFLLTASGTPTAGTGYIWDDTATWNDTYIWTETSTADTIQLKVTMLPPYDIQVVEV